MSKWITMAYPTWLLFLRDETRFEEFLSDVYIPFDCVFMVAQRDSQGTEIIQDVYRIGKEDYLRSMTFGMWNASHGFQGPFLGLYQRRHDLHGHNIRVAAINVSQKKNNKMRSFSQSDERIEKYLLLIISSKLHSYFFATLTYISCIYIYIFKIL